MFCGKLISIGGTSVEQLGERIKRLRKERKMTLADVAGDRLTKGMLSLIENGKANPSMESLQYIAEQLNINASELIQTDETENLRELLFKTEKLYREYVDTYSTERINEIKTDFLNELAPFINGREITGSSYEEIRIYEIFLVANYYFTGEFNEDEIRKVAKMYENVHAFSRILGCYAALCMKDFSKLNYESAAQKLLEGEKVVDQYKNFIGSIEKLDFYYNLTVVFAALNDEERTEHYLNLALEIAKEKKVFYRLNDFYRFLYYLNLQKLDRKKCDYYYKKMQAFMVIMEDPIEEMMVELLWIPYINIFLKDYEAAIAFEFKNGHLYEDVVDKAKPFVIAEKSYAYYMLGDYKNGAQIVQDLEIPSVNTHPIDLAFLYHGFACRALCLFELGQIEVAKRDILYAYNGVKTFSDSMQRRFIINGYERIMKEKL